MRRAFLLLFFSMIPTSWASSQPLALPKDGVAYTVHGKLIIKDASGGLVRVIKATPPIGSFAISPDGQSVVYAPLGLKCNDPSLGEQGGPLYMLSLVNGKIRQLTSSHKPIYDNLEVYADPDFSPDGQKVVFAVHYQPCGDAVMTAGPYAVLNLKTHSIRALASTLNPGSGNAGPAYGANPRWSPDGRRLFLNLDSDFALTKMPGKYLLNTSQWTPGMDTFAVDWLGRNCIVYKGGNENKMQPARALNLRTHRTERLDRLLGVEPEQVTNLVAFSPAVWVRKVGGELKVETQQGAWIIADTDQDTHVRVFSAWVSAKVPLTCQ